MQKPAPQREKGGGPVFFRRWQVVAVAAALVVAVAALLLSHLLRGPGTVAVVAVGQQAQRAQTIRLDRDGEYLIEGGALPVTLEVQNGAIRFINSVCPDHDCEGFGWLRRDGDWALCAPAGVQVWVEEKA